MRSWSLIRRTPRHVVFFTVLCWMGSGVHPNASQAAERFRALGDASKHAAIFSVATELESTLDCTHAIDLVVGATAYGSNVGAAGNVSSYSCSPWVESGGEVVYHLVIADPLNIEITLNADGCDLDVALLDGCDPDVDCLIVGDTGIRSARPVSGEFYLIVDGYQGAECGFEITVRQFFEIPSNPLVCSEAQPVTCSISGELQGSTCGTGNTIQTLGCAYSAASGEDQSYLLSVRPNGYVDATLSMPDSDGILWLLGSCGIPTECIAYSDAGFEGEDEHLRYENATDVTQSVYLVVDSLDPGSCADFSVDLLCSGTTVAIENGSWSALKGLYLDRHGMGEDSHE